LVQVERVQVEKRVDSAQAAAADRCAMYPLLRSAGCLA
jgi:hypothetical protein